MRSVVAAAPAKINLHLRVGPRRGDGYHDLCSWMCTVALFDTIKIVTDGSAAMPRLIVRDGSGADVGRAEVPVDETNLVMRAVRAWTLAAPEGVVDATKTMGITLIKRIPTGAGLGGGSSDAARMLLALDQLHDVQQGPEVLARIGATLGSDVPFFFHAPSAICTGRGEQVRATPPPAAKWAVLIMPELHVPTPAVYAKFDELQLGCDQDVRREPDWLTWSKLPADALLQELVNDLEPAAFALVPKLNELCDRAQRAVKRTIRMSGSGSTLFTLHDDREAAERDARKIENDVGVRAKACDLCPPDYPSR